MYTQYIYNLIRFVEIDRKLECIANDEAITIQLLPEK